jgi:uncharacterized glyoxalase superfamily protein PhnB
MSQPAYRGIFPGLRYHDAPAAITWLERAFGFEPRLVVPGDDGAIVHSQLWAGDTAVSVASAAPDDPFDRVTARESGGVTHLLYFVVDDVDSHHSRAVEAGAEILLPPTDQDYGGRDYTCRDPEGYVWSFGTYAPTKEPS